MMVILHLPPPGVTANDKIGRAACGTIGGLVTPETRARIERNEPNARMCKRCTSK